MKEIWCTACEVVHVPIGAIAGIPLIECANVPSEEWYMMIDTRYMGGTDRAFTGYDGNLWVRYAR